MNWRNGWENSSGSNNAKDYGHERCGKYHWDDVDDVLWLQRFTSTFSTGDHRSHLL
jgi:hypothetical protein